MIARVGALSLALGLPCGVRLLGEPGGWDTRHESPIEA